METDGWQAAFRLFLVENGLIPPHQPAALIPLLYPAKVFEPGPLLDVMKRLNGNWAYMMTCEVQSFIDYAPDLERIAGNHVGIALAAGVDTRNNYFHRTSVVIAERLSVEVVEFPGGHGAPAEIPGLFANKPHNLLGRL